MFYLKFYVVIHVGLLCVEHNPNDRPSMCTVVVMLNSESALPHPKEPIHLKENVSIEGEYIFGQKTYYSNNEVTVSQVEPR